MIDTLYAVRCDVCLNIMSVTGGFPSLNRPAALYPDLASAVAGGNSKLWEVWQEPEDAGTDIWHVLCPNNQT
jgi:hypothetical protein